MNYGEPEVDFRVGALTTDWSEFALPRFDSLRASSNKYQLKTQLRIPVFPNKVIMMISFRAKLFFFCGLRKKFLLYPYDGLVFEVIKS